MLLTLNETNENNQNAVMRRDAMHVCVHEATRFYPSKYTILY